MLVRDAFCSYCGHAFGEAAGYPRTCTSCKTTLYANPIPVSVVLVPVEHEGKTGLLVVRRGIPPQKGKLALVGGFLEEHETWQEGGVREVREETDVIVAATKVRPFWFTSTAPKPNRVLLFSVSDPQELRELAAFTSNEETEERGVIFGPDGLEEVFAFPLHIEAARRYFAEKGTTGPHGFRRA